MREWLNNIIGAKVKKAMPILSFPAVQLLGITVQDLIANSQLQAKAMKAVAERTPYSVASVSLMDLSVEAECFGSNVRFSSDEVPTVIGSIVNTQSDAEQLRVPKVGVARSQIYIDAIKNAKELIKDRPVFAGVIGPFSLAGRLVDVSEAMINCYEEPEMMHIVLEKATTFLIEYINEFKKAGANGVVMAEPLTGLLSPKLAQEFSEGYVRKIAESVKSDDFIVIYHNCGNAVVQMIDSIIATNCDAYHFGNSISMSEVLQFIPKNIVTMGNIDPAGQFRNGTEESIKQVTTQLLNECSSYKNFLISSGCDIPPMSSWKNIDAFFEAVKEFELGN